MFLIYPTGVFKANFRELLASFLLVIRSVIHVKRPEFLAVLVVADSSDMGMRSDVLGWRISL